jgi:hypothetical protein
LIFACGELPLARAKTAPWPALYAASILPIRFHACSGFHEINRENARFLPTK